MLDIGTAEASVSQINTVICWVIPQADSNPIPNLLSSCQEGSAGTLLDARVLGQTKLPPEFCDMENYLKRKVSEIKFM